MRGERWEGRETCEAAGVLRCRLGALNWGSQGRGWAPPTQGAGLGGAACRGRCQAFFWGSFGREGGSRSVGRVHSASGGPGGRC